MNQCFFSSLFHDSPSGLRCRTACRRPAASGLFVKGAKYSVKERHLLAALCLLLVIVMTACAKSCFSRSHASIGVSPRAMTIPCTHQPRLASRGPDSLRIRLTSYLAGHDPSKYDHAVRDAASQNRLVVAVGYSLNEIVTKAADDYSEVASVVFHHCEAAYLESVHAVRSELVEMDSLTEKMLALVYAASLKRRLRHRNAEPDRRERQRPHAPHR